MATSTGTATVISCSSPWLATAALKTDMTITTVRYFTPSSSLK